MTPSSILMSALLLGAARAQFLQHIVTSQDPALALQPPPLQQAQLTPFHQSFLQAPPPPPAPVALMMHQPPPQLAHRAVVRATEEESRLPGELRNNFYKNPRIAEGLAKESWFIPGEEQVLEREAEKIPRDQIFKLLKNAGLARRR